MYDAGIADESLSRLFLDLEPKPASYLNAPRQIEAYSGTDLRSLRVTVLSSFTAEILKPYLLTEAARRGMKLHLYFCPFNQIETQALTPDSDLYSSQPEAIVVALRLE